MENLRSILRLVPRQGLYVIITLLASGLVYLGGARVKAAEMATVEARAGAAAAATVASEAAAKADKALSQSIQALREIRDTRAVVEEIRRDQLEHYRWQAQQAGDWRRESKYANRLRELPSQPR
jgi:hypothetical protein